MLERRKWSCMESVARPTGRSGGSSEIRCLLHVPGSGAGRGGSECS